MPRVAVALRQGGPRFSEAVSSIPHGQVDDLWPKLQQYWQTEVWRGWVGGKACIEAGIHTLPVCGTRLEAAWTQQT